MTCLDRNRTNFPLSLAIITCRNAMHSGVQEKSVFHFMWPPIDLYNIKFGTIAKFISSEGWFFIKECTGVD